MTLPITAVIGTGIMGEPMARNLINAGYTVRVYNRTASKTEALVALGASRFESPGAAAAEASVVISCVSDSPDVLDVYLGDAGIVSALAPGTQCIDMSTIAPDVARRVAQAVAGRGGSFLDAPVSGGRNGAESGQLSIMVGGEAGDVERATPIFDVLGKQSVHGGPVGHGQLMKLCNQILCGLNLLAVSEAVVFARRMGLDVSTMLRAVSGGAAGSWAVDNLGPRMENRDFAPMFMVDLQQKDLRIVLDAAARAPLPLPGTALVSQLLASNQAQGEGCDGTQALVKVVERLAGQ
ncbi:MAG: NAD(P)-dependent oxidoreductase [Planctomycetota bacterium]|jgi:3-hydroxyisobutyrate dehydrogenase